MTGSRSCCNYLQLCLPWLYGHCIDHKVRSPALLDHKCPTHSLNCPSDMHEHIDLQKSLYWLMSALWFASTWCAPLTCGEVAYVTDLPYYRQADKSGACCCSRESHNKYKGVTTLCALGAFCIRSVFQWDSRLACRHGLQSPDADITEREVDCILQWGPTGIRDSKLRW